MNRSLRLLLLVTASACLLSSCIYIFPADTVFTKSTSTVYDLQGLEKSDHVDIVNAYSLDYYTLPEDNNLIPYVSLKGYADMMSHYFDARVTTKFSYQGQNPVWQVYLKSEKEGVNPSYVFFTILDVNRNAFYVGGSLYNTLTRNLVSMSNSSLGMASYGKDETLQEGRSYSIYSFNGYSHGKRWSNGDVYLPLGYFDAAIGQTCSIYHLFDMNRFFAYSEPGETYLSNLYYGDIPINCGDNIARYYTVNGMPLPLREYERDIMYFVFDNRYGLAEYKKIPSMSSYYKSIGVDDLLLSPNPESREEGFFKAINVLEDLHTGPRAIASWWGDTRDGITYSNRRNRYSEVSNLLKENRTETFGSDIKKIQYHEDMAFISMDGFEASFEAYEEDGKTINPSIYEEDTFFYMTKQLTEASKNENIHDVVIDLSVNGGGYVAIMRKIVTLLSKTNHVTFGYYDSEKGADIESTVSVDSNLDGKYDEKDVFGNRFNFYILTSSCSYSAGNAMPCFSRFHGFAKTIGENSGGGECTVESVCLPSGRSFGFSTPLHIVFHDKQASEMIGVESGAGIDYPVEYNNFYDLEYLYQTIHAN